MTNPRNLPEALAALKLVTQQRDAARIESDTYYRALEAALARHAAEMKQLKQLKQLKDKK